MFCAMMSLVSRTYDDNNKAIIGNESLHHKKAVINSFFA